MVYLLGGVVTLVLTVTAAAFTGWFLSYQLISIIVVVSLVVAIVCAILIDSKKGDQRSKEASIPNFILIYVMMFNIVMAMTGFFIPITVFDQVASFYSHVTILR
ncbi:MAG: hypothetical protein ABA06_03085 [Parcubacteria bacterium C7867-001]|nr:MAG: hypothetical protein ABA06_03085 [Parcubacteria bacterium C7867-001]